jgi:hypothetical protein
VDQEIGHAEDFVVDEETWVIRYLVVGTSNSHGGRLAMIAPEWIDWIHWDRSTAHVNLTSADVRESPAFDRSSFNDFMEQRLLAYHEHVLARSSAIPH